VTDSRTTIHPTPVPRRFPRRPRPLTHDYRSFGNGGQPIAFSSQPEETPTTAGAPDVSATSRRTEIAGFAITVAGVLLALFLLYLYVFSSLTAARDQNRLLHKLTGDPKAVFSLASGVRPKDGEPVAIMTIPSIGLHQGVIEGTSAADLQEGPGLSNTAGIPGDVGNAIIAGRRTSFGAPFGRLASLQAGDDIDVVDGAGKFTFSVFSVQTISNGSISVPKSGPSWLTLVTSNSSWVPTGKLVVVARLVGQPNTAGSELTSYAMPNLSGDPSAGFLAAIWALMFVASLIFMVFAIRRWRQTWITWLLAAPILVACGLFACESLARCLPSTL
jgi:sortase A